MLWRVILVISFGLQNAFAAEELSGPCPSAARELPVRLALSALNNPSVGENEPTLRALEAIDQALARNHLKPSTKADALERLLELSRQQLPDPVGVLLTGINQRLASQYWDEIPAGSSQLESEMSRRQRRELEQERSHLIRSLNSMVDSKERERTQTILSNIDGTLRFMDLRIRLLQTHPRPSSSE